MATAPVENGNIVEFYQSADPTSGVHVLYVFQDPNAYLRNFISFITSGLEAEHQLVIMEEPQRYRRALAQLRETGYDRALENMVYHNNEAFYTGHGQDLTQILEDFASMIEPFREQGLPVRTWARVAWDGYDDLVNKIHIHEQEADECVNSSKTLAVCVYDGSDLSANHLLELMRSHQYIMNDRELTRSSLYHRTEGEAVRTSIQNDLATTITQLELYRHSVARLNKLEVIAETAFHVSHEVRNPISTARGLVQLVQMRSTIEEDQQLLATAINEIDRASAILTGLMGMGKDLIPSLADTNLTSLVKDMTSLLRHMAEREEKQLRLELEDVPDIRLDQHQIRQVIVNLVRNALEAMPAGGAVTLETSARGPMVTLVVRDEGSGIPREIKEKLGTPFVTTKPHGTGLGLATSYRIIERHGGGIEVETGDDGTTFYISFPILSFNAERTPGSPG